MSAITAIQLIMMRAATQAERDAYAELERLYDDMDEDERRERGIHKPADLGSDRNPGSHVTHYATGAYYSETFREEGLIQMGIPGATERMKKVIASMLKRYASRRHLQYYAVGEIEDSKGRPMGFRTLCARTEFRFRYLGYRNRP